MFLSLLCNLGAIGGYSTGVFGSVLFAAVVVMSAPTQKNTELKTRPPELRPNCTEEAKTTAH